jgi:biotin operon repressor
MLALEHTPDVTAPSQRVVLLVLAARVDQHQCQCKVSLDRLAHNTSLNRVTVWRAVRNLRALGHISYQTEPGKRTVYTVHIRPDQLPGATPDPLHQATPPVASGNHTSRVRQPYKESLDKPDGSDAAPAPYFAPGSGWIENWSNP